MKSFCIVVLRATSSLLNFPIIDMLMSPPNRITIKVREVGQQNFQYFFSPFSFSSSSLPLPLTYNVKHNPNTKERIRKVNYHASVPSEACIAAFCILPSLKYSDKLLTTSITLSLFYPS